MFEGRAAALVTHVARRAAEHGQLPDIPGCIDARRMATPLLALARELRGLRMRATATLVRWSFLPRLCMAAAIAVIVAAPSLVHRVDGTSVTSWYAVACALTALSYASYWASRSCGDAVADSFAAMRANSERDE